MREKHGRGCKWPKGQPCREFSTDGTLLGAQIAHTFETTDELAIAEGRSPYQIREGIDTPVLDARLTGVPEEQADWESDDL